MQKLTLQEIKRTLQSRIKKRSNLLVAIELEGESKPFTPSEKEIVKKIVHEQRVDKKLLAGLIYADKNFYDAKSIFKV